jgi:hypothetical protein
MRLLNRLGGKLPIWPFDPLPPQGSLVVEMYARAFIRLGGLSGRKLRTLDQLNQALAGLGSEPTATRGFLNDHETDVLVSAAGLRAIAHQKRFWSPAGLGLDIARTEGWTFGVL